MRDRLAGCSINRQTHRREPRPEEATTKRGSATSRVEEKRGREVGSRFDRPTHERSSREGAHSMTCVSPSPSKIPYGEFSPVRLQTDCRRRPSPLAPLGSMQSTSPGTSALYAATAQASLDRGPGGQTFRPSGRPEQTSSMTTWVDNQFPRPDFHRLVWRHYGLHTPDTLFFALFRPQ